MDMQPVVARRHMVNTEKPGNAGSSGAGGSDLVWTVLCAAQNEMADVSSRISVRFIAFLDTL